MRAASARWQVAGNLAFTLVKSVSVLLSIRLADTYLAAQVLGFVLLFRRQGTMWGNLTQLGMSQSLQRYYLGLSDDNERAQLWSRLTRWVVATAIALCLASLVFGTQLADFLFARNEPMVAWAFALYVASVALGYMATSSWMVEFRVTNANIIDWLNGSLIFIGCLLLASHQAPATFVMLLSIVSLSASAVWLVWFRQRHVVPHLKSRSGWRLSSGITTYGLTRGLSAFADMGSSVLGPWLLSSSPDDAAHLIIAYTVVRLAQAVVMPVAKILALRANSSRHDQEIEAKRVRTFNLVAIGAAVVCVLAYYPLASYFVPLIAPRSHEPVQAIVDQLMPFLPAVFGFYAMRNYVELRFHFPINLCTLVVSMLALLGVVWMYGTVDLESVVLGSKAMFGVLYVYTIVALALTYWPKRT